MGCFGTSLIFLLSRVKSSLSRLNLANSISLILKLYLVRILWKKTLAELLPYLLPSDNKDSANKFAKILNVPTKPIAGNLYKITEG